MPFIEVAQADWTPNIAMVVEGILKPYDDDYALPAGVRLYRALVETHRVVLIIDTDKRKETEFWLQMHGLVGHAGVIYNDPGNPEDKVERRDWQIKQLKQHAPLNYLIESDPSVVERMLENGVPTFFYVHPEYIHADHRPGTKQELTSWDSLMSAVRREKELRVGDTRYDD